MAELQCRRVQRFSALLLLCGLTSCATEPLEFADWMIEVPEGTPLREYPPVTMEERDPDAIRLTEDLVIGVDAADPSEGVFTPTFVVAAEDGTIFVFDSAANHVQVYDRHGRYQRTLGRDGQGPGEFGSVWGMTIAGALLVVDDRSNRRFSTWTLDGAHAGDYRKESWGLTQQLQGLSDGTVVVRTSVGSGDDELGVVIRTSIDGSQITRLDEMVPAPPLIPDGSWTPVDIARGIVTLFDDPIRAVAVGADDAVYITPVQEYQVLAVSDGGIPAWALRVAWPRPRISTRVKEAVLRQANRDGGSVRESDVDWPEYRALARLLTDGDGRLYVVPEVGFQGDPPSRMPADVYSPEGYPVASGFIPASWPELYGQFRAPWSYAVGEYLYGLKDDVSGETVAVRYRLEVREQR